MAYQNYLVADAKKNFGGTSHRIVGRADKTWIPTAQKQTYPIGVITNCGNLPTLWLGFIMFYPAMGKPDGGPPNRVAN